MRDQNRTIPFGTIVHPRFTLYHKCRITECLHPYIIPDVADISCSKTLSKARKKFYEKNAKSNF